MPSPRETRFILADFEVRDSVPDAPPVIAGYGAVFNRQSDIMSVFGMQFAEKIAPGAFANALTRSDPRALFNHDANYVLGRSSAGTLAIQEDAKGLRYEVNPPDTAWARDLMVSMRRGDITQSSFGFTVAKDSWETLKTDTGRLEVRTILEIGELFDVSPVTYPAYPDATSFVRSMTAGAPEDLKNLIASRQNPQQPGRNVETLKRKLTLIGYR